MSDEYWYLKLASDVAGWIYFAAWSLSFYPQAIVNYKHKSVSGFSIEFAILNTTGFFFYSLYSIGGYVYPHLGTGVIHENDLVFAGHAFIFSSVHLTQVFIYQRGMQTHFKAWAVNLLLIQLVMVTTLFILEGLIGASGIPLHFNTFKFAGYSKALITLLKYCPQVYLNYVRKSTVGWSIFTIICDFTGGTFSILQQFIDMFYNGYTNGDWSFFGNSSDAFNIVKFLLGIISIIFDLIFMTQHWVLYPDQHPEEEKGLMTDSSFRGTKS